MLRGNYTPGLLVISQEVSMLLQTSFRYNCVCKSGNYIGFAKNGTYVVATHDEENEVIRLFPQV